MAKKICLISDHHISINPRLWKEAFVYEAAGFEVVVITQWTSDYFLDKDKELLKEHAIRYEAYLDMRPGKSAHFLRLYYRTRMRVGRELKKRLGISRPWAVTYAPELLFRKALLESADLYSAHLEAGFIAGGNLVKAGLKVGFDLEDWYSRDYVTADRVTNLLHLAEGFALEHGAFFMTTSHALADAIQQTWNSKKAVTVVYNSFPEKRGSDRPSVREHGNSFRLVWTSRTIGPNRGLETLIRALALVKKPVELRLIGMMPDSFLQVVNSIWPRHTPHRLVVHNFVSHHTLEDILASADLGVAVEMKTPDSRNKTITNKILQYIQAGLRVLATDTDGQREVAIHFPESVFLVPDGDPNAWAAAISRTMDRRDDHYRERQVLTYRKQFSWAAQQEKIIQLINQQLWV